MKANVKSDCEIKKMKEAGEKLTLILSSIVRFISSGVSTKDIDKKAIDLCKKHNVKPAFLGYKGYPAAICIGINDVVVHGIPSESDVIRDGDILSVDMGIIYEGFYSDMAVTIGVGKVRENAQRLIDVTKECLKAGIKEAVEGKTIGDIGYAIQSKAEASGFSVVRQMVGHGIGRYLHEDPQIPGFGNKGEGSVLVDGMTVAIEAIINEGGSEIYFLTDGWTTKTVDGKLSALFEHTVKVGKEKAEMLTKWI